MIINPIQNKEPGKRAINSYQRVSVSGFSIERGETNDDGTYRILCGGTGETAEIRRDAVQQALGTSFDNAAATGTITDDQGNQ